MKYRIGFSYTEYGHKYIEAKTAKEAERKLYKELAENGLGELKDYSCNDREYHTEALSE